MNKRSGKSGCRKVVCGKGRGQQGPRGGRERELGPPFLRMVPGKRIFFDVVEPVERFCGVGLPEKQRRASSKHRGGGEDQKSSRVVKNTPGGKSRTVRESLIRGDSSRCRTSDRTLSLEKGTLTVGDRKNNGSIPKQSKATDTVERWNRRKGGGGRASKRGLYEKKLRVDTALGTTRKGR